MRRWCEISECIPAYLVVTKSLESLTERCEGALCLLGEALQSMDTAPMPDNIKVQNMCFEHHISFKKSELIFANY